MNHAATRRTHVRGSAHPHRPTRGGPPRARLRRRGGPRQRGADRPARVGRRQQTPSDGLDHTEQSQGPSLHFRSFLAARHLPGFGAGLGWAVARRRLRRNRFVLGGAFADRSLIDGEFDEFFLRPIHELPERRRAAVEVLRSFDTRLVHDLTAVHRRLEVPVRLVWGDRDPFFPLAWAEEMTATFADADLTVIEGAGLFSHEERPAEVAHALIPTLLGHPVA